MPDVQRLLSSALVALRNSGVWSGSNLRSSSSIASMDLAASVRSEIKVSISCQVSVVISNSLPTGAPPRFRSLVPLIPGPHEGLDAGVISQLLLGSLFPDPVGRLAALLRCVGDLHDILDVIPRLHHQGAYFVIMGRGIGLGAFPA